MESKRFVSTRQRLAGVTPYPWHRDHRGNLCGANGEPIYFRGPDAVIVEYSPEMTEALGTIRATAAARTPNPAAALEKIFRLADELLARVETANAERKWCRGIVRS